MVCVCAIVFVGSDVLERKYIPDLSIGYRHLLLTIRSALVTALGSAIVYLVMRRQQMRIERTADELGRRLEAYRANNGSGTRFENPHLVRCRDVQDCDRTDCPMHDAAEGRCWQVIALSRNNGNGEPRDVTIHRCHECRVYRMSCPDGLTRLGESFNSLLFMLDEEAERVRQMHSQMVEREKMSAIGLMAAGIAHEVGNPLSSISSIVQMLRRRGVAPEQAGQLDLIQTHIQRISTTVRQLSGLARPAPERWELVDPLAALDEAVRLVSFDQRAHHVTIDFQKPASLPTTYALRQQLQQVFINLMLNALDAMPDRGALIVRVEERSSRIVFHFDDSGCGIPREIGRRVFEPFFTTKEPGKGTGLGLSVSYGIVEKHRGRIEFESEEGKGTRFTVELPVLDAPPESAHGADHHTARR